MRWIVILINAHLCCGVVIRINPIKIITYTKPNRSSHAAKSKWNINPATKEFQVQPLIPGEKIESYAGYLKVDQQHDSNLFFWFFPSENKPANDPLIVWLQGQPYASSLYGLFDENGPYRIDPKNGTLQVRPYSWTKNMNVLYLDPCTSCGFSYSSHTAGNSLAMDDVAKNVIKALQAFFMLFPKIQDTPVYLAGESMAGKYIFIIADIIIHKLDYSDNFADVRGIIIGNGFMDALQIAEQNDYLFQMGIFDLKQYEEMNLVRDYIQSKILAGKYQEAIDVWRQQCYRKVKIFGGYNSMYDVRNTNAFWDSLVPQVVDLPSIRSELKVGRRRFQVAQNDVYHIREAMIPIENIVGNVLENFQVLFYSGQFDMLVPYTHTASYLDRLQWIGMRSYYNAPYEPWIMQKDLRYDFEVIKGKETDRDVEDTLVGYVKNSGNLHFVLILSSGHHTGVSQPQVLQQMVENFIRGNFTRTANGKGGKPDEEETSSDIK